MINKDKSIDNCVTIVITFMIMSFYLFELNSWGRYVIIMCSIIIFYCYSFKNSFKISFRFEKFHLLLLVFSIYCILSAIWAWNPSASIQKGISLISILICYCPIYMYYKDKGSIDTLLLAFMLSGFGIVLYSISFYGLSGLMTMLAGGTRLGNDYTNANSIGLVATISIIIQYNYILQKRHYLTLPLVIPSIILVAASQSRKALVLLLLGIVLLTIVASTNRKTLIFRIVISIGVLMLFIMAVRNLELFSGVNKRFISYFESLSGTREENIRDIYRQIGYQQFFKTPIVGIGIGNSAELLESLGYRRTYLHDNYAELLACGGIIGTIIYYSMYFSNLKNLWDNRFIDPEITRLCLILLSAITIMDYGMVTYYDKQQYLYLMCFFLQVSFISNKRTFGGY